MPIDSAAAGGQEKDGQEIRALEEVVGIIDQNIWGNESEPPARVSRGAVRRRSFQRRFVSGMSGPKSNVGAEDLDSRLSPTEAKDAP